MQKNRNYPVTQASILDNCVIPINRLLNEGEKALLLQNANVLKFKRKETIVKQGNVANSIIYLNEGLVKITRELRRDKGLVIKLEREGMFLCLISQLNATPYNFTITALEQCTVTHFNRDTFIEIMQNNGMFATEIARIISNNTIDNINRISGLTHKQLPGRIADLILYLANQIYKSNQFQVPLTRKELAELCGTTKESLIRTLSEFNHDKIIDIQKNTISIRSYEILSTLSRLG